VNSRLTYYLLAPYRYYLWLASARPIRFTRFGSYYILFAIGIGAAAINTGNNLLYLILGMMLGFIVVSGFLSDSCLWGLNIRWSPVGSMYAGRPGLFACEISKGWFPAVQVRLRAEWDHADPAAQLVYWIGPQDGTDSNRGDPGPARMAPPHTAPLFYAISFRAV